MPSVKSAAFLFVVLGVSLAPLGCKKKGGDLDGKTFQVTVTDPQGKGEPDTITFAAGQLDSVGCQKYGFPKAPYKVTKSGSAVTFSSEAKSAKEGMNKWEGKVEGDKIEGTLVWTKPGQAPISYKFNGKVVAK